MCIANFDSKRILWKLQFHLKTAHEQSHRHTSSHELIIIILDLSSSRKENSLKIQFIIITNEWKFFLLSVIGRKRRSNEITFGGKCVCSLCSCWISVGEHEIANGYFSGFAMYSVFQWHRRIILKQNFRIVCMFEMDLWPGFSLCSHTHTLRKRTKSGPHSQKLLLFEKSLDYIRMKMLYEARVFFLVSHSHTGAVALLVVTVVTLMKYSIHTAVIYMIFLEKITHFIVFLVPHTHAV